DFIGIRRISSDFIGLRGIHWTSSDLGFIGIHEFIRLRWISSDFTEIHLTSSEFIGLHRTSSDFEEFIGLRWTRGIHRISPDFTGLHRTSPDFAGLHRTSSDFTGLHRTLWDF
ncbi:hypothetical protein ALC57_14093, partial [Trachymyrmex cornetzi]